ncbi:hypothetical protein PAPYR_13083 [Paratrimastix pyriformis]|uniref:Uncharacterized protein n=1 Tax=Paratrimastix pyriformis TaxID=342808 RepID=A0ABQ8U3A1_9EUKA|nr:hypothetical protein PAPYR_13083 [Paratrimastix pyriformis]
MWQANLTEWYEETRRGQPQEGGKPRRRGQPQEENPAVGDNLKKEENPPSGTTSRAALGDIGWVGYGHDGGKPQEGDNLKKEENPGVGDNLKGHRWAPSAGWGTDTEEENPRGQPQEEEGGNPAEGDNLMREGAEENPGFGENLDGRMEDHAGDGNASQAGDIGGILLWLRWLGLASFCLREVWKETGSDIMDASDNAAWGTEGLACQANWNFIVDRLKRWVGMKEVEKGWADIDLVEKAWVG